MTEEIICLLVCLAKLVIHLFYLILFMIEILCCFVFRIEFLRSIREFFQVMFKMEPHKRADTDGLMLGDDKILLTCMGVGFSNLNKVIL